MPASSGHTIVKNTLFLYFRMFITMIVSLFTVRVVLRTLGVVDYGVYGAIGGVVTTLAFLTDVLANASQRFFSVALGKKDSKSLQQTFGLVFFAYVLTALGILLLAETVGIWFVNNKMEIPPDRMDAARVVYQLSVATFLLSMVISPYDALVIANERMNIYAYISILQVFLKLGIVFLLVVLPFDKLKMYALLMFLVSVLIGAIYVVFCRKSFPESRLTFQWDLGIFKSIFSYSSWTLLGSLAFICNTQGLNILFNLFFGPVANAAYSIGSQVKTAVNSFASNFFVATRPPMIKSYSEGDYDYTNKLFYFSSKVIFALLFILIAPLFVEIEYVLRLWLGEVEPYMASFVRLMLIYAIVLSISEPITAIVQAAGKVKVYHGIVDTFTLLTLPLSYLAFRMGLEPQYGFLISIGIFVVAHVMRLYILRSFFAFSIRQYIRTFVFPCMSAALLSVALIYAFSRISVHPLLTIAVAGIIAVGLVAFLVFGREERMYVIRMVLSKLPGKHE